MVLVSQQDVMVVGEPTLMGGEFGDEDERLITRLENQQYEPNCDPEDPDGQKAAVANQFVNSPSWTHDKKPPPGTMAPLDEVKQE